MNRSRLHGGLVVSAVVIAVFAGLWAMMVSAGDQQLSAGQRVGVALVMAVLATPWLIAGWLLWGAWWRRAGAGLSRLDGPARLLAAARAMLPDHRRAWGAAMAAELDQVRGRGSRWRFAAGCARATSFPPSGNRAAVGVAAALAIAAMATAALATGAALPGIRVLALTLVGLVGGLATLTVARARQARPGPAVAGLTVAGVAACIAWIAYYLVNHPSYHTYHRGYPPARASLTPPTALVLAVVLAGSLWLVLAPPRWLVASRPAGRFGAGMAIAMVVAFVVASRLGLRGAGGLEGGIMSQLILAPTVVLVAGSAAAAAAGRSFHAGVQACAWANVLGTLFLIAAWLAEGLRWNAQRGVLLLDADGPVGVGANLGDAVVWTLLILLLWALPLGVIGAAAGSLPSRRRRRRGQAEPAPTAGI
jgi:hypothetical protein